MLKSSPHVAKLNDRSVPSGGLGRIAWVRRIPHRVLAYLLAFQVPLSMQAKNFNPFWRDHRAFLYIDQVGVCERQEAQVWLRKCMHVWSVGYEIGIFTLGCGVNLQPANPVSMGFTEKSFRRDW